MRICQVIRLGKDIFFLKHIVDLKWYEILKSSPSLSLSLSRYLSLYIYVFTNHLFDQDVIQGLFSSEIQHIWIQSFPSPRLVIIPRLKSSILPTGYP